MKTIRNEKMIKRKANIGKYAGIVSLVILAGGMYLSFRYKTQVWYSLIALILGFVLSQISISYTNQFGSLSRPDIALDNALKGLDDRYALYHYTTPVKHLLVGPAGVWVCFPFHQKGRVTYNEKKEKWNRKGGNIYMKFFAQDSIGRPSLEITAAKEKLRKFFEKIPEFEVPPIHAALIFTNDEMEVDADEAPSPTLHALQLKKFIRKEEKGERSLSMTDVRKLQGALEPDA